MMKKKNRKVVVTVISIKEEIGNHKCPHKIGDTFVISGPMLRVKESNDVCLTAYDTLAAPIWSMKYLPQTYFTGPFKDTVLGCPDHHKVLFKIEVFEDGKKLN